MVRLSSTTVLMESNPPKGRHNYRHRTRFLLRTGSERVGIVPLFEPGSLFTLQGGFSVPQPRTVSTHMDSAAFPLGEL